MERAHPEPKIRLTQSSLKTLGSCEEKYRLRYIEGLRSSTVKPALSIGSAFHAGIEAKDPQAAEDALRGDRGASYGPDDADGLARDIAVVRAMVEGALLQWTTWPDPEDREVAFELPLRNPATGAPSTRHVLAGVIDGVFPLGYEFEEEGKKLRVGPRAVLLEMKTTSRLDADYMRRLDLDFQISAYCHAASAIFGAPVREVVYRVVRKPSIRPKSKVKRPDVLDEKGKATYSPETMEEYGERVRADYRDRPEFYFAEELVARDDAQLERWWHEAWEIHRRVLRLEAGEMSVRNTQHCLDWGRCDYFDLCRGVVSTEGFIVLDNVNPELPSPDNTKETRT